MVIGLISVVIFRINVILVMLELNVLFSVILELFFSVVIIDIIIFGVEVLKLIINMFISSGDSLNWWVIDVVFFINLLVFYSNKGNFKIIVMFVNSIYIFL